MLGLPARESLGGIALNHRWLVVTIELGVVDNAHRSAVLTVFGDAGVRHHDLDVAHHRLDLAPTGCQAGFGRLGVVETAIAFGLSLVGKPLRRQVRGGG